MTGESTPRNDEFTVRHMSSAFIWNGPNVLMLKKASTSALFPDLWVPVGGHIRPEECSSPKDACLREIQEETGLSAGQLGDLKLMYITVRRKKEEIRIQHLFFCHTESRDVVDSSEGILAWVQKQRLQGLKTSYTSQAVLRHYFTRDLGDESLYMGVVEVHRARPEMNWIKLESLDSPF